jgi:ABC-type uncharacterized transport system YnjBCD ATPase subunit
LVSSIVVCFQDQLFFFYLSFIIRTLYFAFPLEVTGNATEEATQEEARY